MSYKKNKHSKTLKQRGGFERNLFKQLKDQTTQDNLVCILMNNQTLKYFAIDILYDLLFKLKECTDKEGINFDELVKKNITQKEENDVIKTIGFNPYEVNKLINTFHKGKSVFIRLGILHNKIHATTACLTNLNNQEFQSLYIRNDSELFGTFITKLRAIFNLPASFDEEEFNNLYKKTNKEQKKAFDMLVTKILHTTNNVSGAIQMNYGREIFARVNRPSNFEKKSEPVKECFTDIINKNGTNKIYGVTNILSTENTFIESIFDNYNRRLIGGISGSAYYLFFLISKILRYNINKKETLSKILCLTIMDYVPVWHSVEEILLTLSVEFEKYGFKRYTLERDPIDYFKYIIEDSSEIKATTNSRTRRNIQEIKEDEISHEEVKLEERSLRSRKSRTQKK